MTMKRRPFMKKLFSMLITGILCANFMAAAVVGAPDLTFNGMFFNVCDTLIKDYENGKYGDEMYCLASGSGWGYDEQIVIYIKDNKATIVFYQAGGRYKTRSLSTDELKAFTAFIKENKIDNLKDWDTGDVDDGIEYQYLHAAKNKRATFYINNPDYGGDIYEELVEKFYELEKTGSFRVSYSADKYIKGLKVLIRYEDYKIKSVWQQGNDIRVLVKENKEYQMRDKLVWHKFENNTVGGKTVEPTGINIINAFESVPTGDFVLDGDEYVTIGPDFEFMEHLNNYPWQSQWGSYLVYSLRDYESNTDGLWLTQKGKNPKLINEGVYAHPVVIPHTDWVVCAKADEGWAYPNHLVKINLKTFKEYVLNFEPADDLRPIVYVNGKLLVQRNKDNYLLDVITNEKTLVTEDCTLLMNVRERFLQKASQKNEYYAAKNNRGDTIIGKFNTETFKFSKIAEYKDIYFNSMHMWVDEAGKKVYVVVNGDLLELPIN